MKRRPLNRAFTRSMLTAGVIAGVVALTASERTCIAQATPRAEAGDARFDAGLQQIEIMRLVVAKSVNQRFADMMKEKQAAAKKIPPATAVGGAAAVTRTPAPAETPVTPAPPAPSAPPRAALHAEQVAAELEAVERFHETGSVYAFGTAIRPSQYTSNTRGFYDPEIGIIFSTEVSVPMEASALSKEEVKPTEDDLWSQATAEVRGSPSSPNDNPFWLASGRNGGESRTIVFADGFIDAAVDAVIEAVGEYGSKLDLLTNDRQLVICMRFNGGGMINGASSEVATYVYYTGRSAAAEHAVMRINGADIAAMQTGEIDADELRERASINRY